MTFGETLQCDVLIVGGGLVGLASAHAIALSGASVVCVDAEGLGGQQSSQNWGFVRQQGRGAAELEMMKYANQRWQALGDTLEADISWTQEGNLAVFETATEEQGYRNWVELGRYHGVKTSYIEAAEISTIIPQWKRPVRGGIFAPEDGQADPHDVVKAYVHACQEAGVELLPYNPVKRLMRSGSKITGAQTGSHVINADTTIVAAGSWSRRLLGTIGVDLPQNYVVGTVALTSKLPPLTKTTVWGPGFSFRQRRDGRFVTTVGGGGLVKISADVINQAPLFMAAFRKNWRRFSLRPSARIGREMQLLIGGRHRLRELGPPTPRIQKSESRRALRELKRTLEGTKDVQLEDSWAGVIDSTPDGLPVIDGRPGPDGLIVATGFSGHGYGLVPAVGPTVADLAQNREPRFDLSAFQLSRFRGTNYKAPDAVL